MATGITSPCLKVFDAALTLAIGKPCQAPCLCSKVLFNYFFSPKKYLFFFFEVLWVVGVSPQLQPALLGGVRKLLHPSPDGERGLCRERETTSWAVRTFRCLSAGSCDAAGPFPGGITAAFSLEEKKLTRCKTPRQLLPSGWRSQDLKPEVFRAL